MPNYPCPCCGKENGSDGEHFCGTCESNYQQTEWDRLKDQYDAIKDLFNEDNYISWDDFLRENRG